MTTPRKTGGGPGVLVNASGPYRVLSLANGQLLVTPTWPQFKTYTDEDGGGPGVLSRLELAESVERLLNGRVRELI